MIAQVYQSNDPSLVNSKHTYYKQWEKRILGATLSLWEEQNLITNGRNERDFKLNFCFSRNFNPRSFFRRSSYLIVINIKCIFSTTVLISYQIKMKLLPVIYLTAEILYYLVLSTSLLTTHNGGVTGEINIGRKKICKIVTNYLF